MSFQKQIDAMSKEELEQLKEELFQSIDRCYSEDSWRTRESLNMKISAIGLKILRVAKKIYPQDSDEFKACQKRVFNTRPHYHKQTEEEKNEKVIQMMSNELEAESQYVSRYARRLGYQSRYPRKMEEKQHE